MADLSVAQTIFSQLGGGRFTAMTGAKQFIGFPKALSFRLPGGSGRCKDGINYVKITLDASDTYTVGFWRIRGRNVLPVALKSNIYADQLRDVFTRETGLHTSLGIPAAEMRKFHNRHED